MSSYLGRRALLGLAQVLTLAVAVFLLVEALPGDAAVALAGDDPDPGRIERIRVSLGLDRPIPERLLDWLAALAHGDLGTSVVSGRAVTDIIGSGLGVTATLAGATLVLLVPLAVGLGVLAARRPGSRLDRGLTAVFIGLHAVPEFALAILLVAVFGIGLGWLPPTAVGVDPLLDPVVLLLPLVVLLARPVCSISRLVRASMITANGAEYVRHAHRLGLSGRRVRLAHALPNALAPAATQLARTTDWLLGGVVVVEAVFVLPGVGTILVDAVAARDLPVVQGLALLFATTTVTVNLMADALSFRLAPRAGVGV
ncbi:ABC transporter permease [Actinokineospora sp. PR83]|uniref:ABC transporter permease n=1 Tax=Actinokineospora sp. PR83 TaxID=2884908 RepID=UPI0027DFACF9|nr:ABC transporter permease [Actinokineospora sp. PR83]MCG8918437.1 ABC transporter permease [Actinokineospora sp. PR83]